MPARNLNVTLNTSLGFGGANTSVVLGRSPLASAPRRNSSIHDVMISGIGVVLPGLIGRAALAAHVDATGAKSDRNMHADTGNVPEDSILPHLNARRVRRMSDYVKLSLAATALACKDAGIDANAEFLEGCSVILGSTHGAANYCQSYYKQIVEQGISAANPMLFAEGVPNAAAAHLSLMLSLKGACQTVIGSRTAGLDALRLAATRIASGQWSHAIVGAAEEYCDVINQAYRHCGLYAGPNGTAQADRSAGFVVGAGAVTLVLESRESLDRRGGKALGRVACSSSRRFRSSEALDATLQVLHELHDPARVISSANNTWVDRSESAAIRRVNPNAVAFSLYGSIAETFSVGPLAGIAAHLTGKQRKARDEEFAVLGTDYTGLVAGARIEPLD